jgi:hypothetical protein
MTQSTHPHKIENAVHALEFALAGNARITVVSKKTGARFTYRIAKPKKDTANGGRVIDYDAKLFFVSLLNGPDNESSFAYIGLINEANDFVRTAKSRVGEDALSMRGFRYVWGKLVLGELPADIEFWHEGSCGRCGRPLTVPESIARGIGPECAKHFGSLAPLDEVMHFDKLDALTNNMIHDGTEDYSNMAGRRT